MTILGRSRLTSRRRECLAALARVTAASGGPVHYSAIAGPLRITAWTAYDLLGELERDGLVVRVRAHRPGAAVGRPQVTFAPTPAGRAALGDAPAPEVQALRRARDRVAALGPVAAAGAAAVGSHAGDLSAHLGFWLHQADGLSARTRDSLRSLLRGAPEAGAGLAMFVGAVYGALAPASVGETADALSAQLTEFQARLARTTAARRDRLARSLQTLLERPAAAPRPITDRA